VRRAAALAILALAGAEICATEARHAGQREGCERKGNPCRVGKKGGKPARAEDGEPGIAEGRHGESEY